jgi:AsmA-like C-terminal region
LTASGSAGGDIRVDGKVAAGGLETAIAGTMWLAEPGRKASLDLSAAAVDVLALRREVSAPAPVTVKTKIVLADDNLAFRDFTVNLAGSAVRGQMSLVLAQPIHVDGRIAAEAIDVPAVITAAIGMPAQGGARTNQSRWPIEPFAANPFAGVEGKIPFYAVRATLGPGTIAQQVRGVVRFEPSGMALEDGEGNLADGRLLVQANVRRDENGLSAHGQISLANADMAVLSGATSRAAGRLSLQVAADATGLSPATLVGAMSGTGTVSVESAQFGGLDPAAIDAAIQSVDRGVPVDSPRINDVINAALEAGKLNVPSATGTITISSGRARITSLAAPAQGADVSFNTVLDFVEQDLDGRVTLLGAPRSAAAASLRPEVSVDFKGPISAPRRSVEPSAFIGWLTLRSVERETKRLEEIQSKAPNKDPGNVGSTPARMGQDRNKLPDLPPPIDIKPPVAPKVSRPPRTLAAPETESEATPAPLR